MRRFLFIIGFTLLPLAASHCSLWASHQNADATPGVAVQQPDAGQSQPVTTDAAQKEASTVADDQSDPVGNASSPTMSAADGGSGSKSDSDDSTNVYAPVLLLVIGIVSVLGMIIGLKLNAFMALIISALIVSLGVGLVDGEDAGSRMSAVVQGFGGAAGGIGIVIAMAAIIGKCMLDSGAADRIVRSAIHVTGEKKASFGLMLSGFVLAIPVFFDTVFYLLVPLARSLYRRTNKNYLRYLMTC